MTQRADMERVFAMVCDTFGAVRGIVDIVGMAKLAPIAGFTDADYARLQSARPLLPAL